MISPDIDEGKGRGRVRRYSEQNLFEFAIIKELNDYGINISSIRHILNQWKKEAMPLKDIEKNRPYLFIQKTPYWDVNIGEVRGSLVYFNKRTGKLKNHAVIDEDMLELYVSTMVIDLWELNQRVSRKIVIISNINDIPKDMPKKDRKKWEDFLKSNPGGYSKYKKK